MTDSPFARLSRQDLESLFNALQVDVVELWECLVSPGWRLELSGTAAAGIHYNLGGPGRLLVGDRSVVNLQRHTLVIVPPGQPLRIEAPAQAHPGAPWKVVDPKWLAIGPDRVRKFVAGDGDPQVMRSAFIARFTAIFGQAPMIVLRTLRMRQAVLLLAAGELPIDSVAREVGYASRSSFVRAFRKTYASHPSTYRLSR